METPTITNILIENLDEIDHWIYDNFGLLPGCINFRKAEAYKVARKVAEKLWPKKHK